jgi:crossover junction endodeoxyribonuclease RuvC
MRVIGIDPALRITGFGIIDDLKGNYSLVKAGTLTSSPDLSVPERLNQIFEGINSLIFEFNPGVMVLEKIFSHYQHPATSFILGQARGVICLAAARSNLDLVEYSATHVKKSIVGNGHASKEQVQKMVSGLLGLNSLPKYKDVTDALALAITYSYISRAHKSSGLKK